MSEVRWNLYPRLSANAHARSWLSTQAKLGLADNTLDAYGRSLEDFLAFTHRLAIEPLSAKREQIAAYVHDLASRPLRPCGDGHALAGLSNATVQLRLTAVRLFYDLLIEDGLRADNPVGRGRYTPGKAFGCRSERGLVPRQRKLPWIPTDEQWQIILEAARGEPLRNRVMLALAYDAGLRSEELCSIQVDDLDFPRRLLTLRAEFTKGRRQRVVPYSAATGQLLGLYLQERRALSRERGSLFLSTSRRNRARPVSPWAWSKVIRALAVRSKITRLTTHTLRHLCLTDLARAGWDIHEIATFAGHRSTQTTLLYIHLSGRELAEKLERGMASVHAWRVAMLKDVLG